MRSKRERKQKGSAVKRNKRKRTDIGADLPFTDEADGVAKLLDGGDEDDSNAVMLLPKVTGAGLPDDDHLQHAAAPPAAKKLSKSQKRKIKKIQEEKAQRAERAKVLASLAEHELQGEHLALMKSTASRGQRETKRQKLKHALALQRAGLQAPEDSQLLVKRPDAQPPTAGIPHSSILPSSPTTQRLHPDFVAQSDEESMEEVHDEEEVDGAATVPLEQQKQLARSIRKDMGIPEPETLLEERRQSHATAGPAPVVLVERPQAMQEARSGLPVIGMEQEIMEAVAENDVILLCGETGSGKTTQVPQFLYEAGYGCSRFPTRAGRIGVTQPRRVAAIAASQRVAQELDCPVGSTVGYQVRYDKRLGQKTAVKFMTDGVLLRELQADLLLRDYSVLVLDEAHERSLNTDLLLGLLSRVVPLRKQLAAQQEDVHPLKLIIMSATLRVEDFASNERLFPQPPPIVRVPARQYPVTVHFARRTQMHDYLGAAFGKLLCYMTNRTSREGARAHLFFAVDFPAVRVFQGAAGVPDEVAAAAALLNQAQPAIDELSQETADAMHDNLSAPDEVCQIHERLPPGGILVFMTGQREVEHLCRRLHVKFNSAKEQHATASHAEGDGGTDGGADVVGDVFGADEAEQHGELEDALADGEARDDFEAEEALEEEDEVQVLGGEGFTPEDIAAAESRFTAQLGGKLDMLSGSEGERRGAGPVHVLPLYAMLPQAAQAAVFGTVSEGHRLIVVATNVAETSLTIPGVRYVVDAGRAKEKVLDSHGAAAKYEVTWISKASAEQRAGRAGRTGPGHCYRLYSSAHFNDNFRQHADPEVLRTPLEGVALVMKAMGIDKVINFPFPTPPEREALVAAQACLQALGALDSAAALTDLGRAMAVLPLNPRPSRMILHVAMEACASGKATPGLLARAVALAAVSSVESPFVHIDSIQAREGESEESVKRRRQVANSCHSRLRVARSDVLSALSAFCAFLNAPEGEAFCRDMYLHHRNLREASALYSQLLQTLRKMSKADLGVVPLGALKTLLADGQHLDKLSPLTQNQLQRGIAAGWADQIARRVRSTEHMREHGTTGMGRTRAVRYTPHALDEQVYMHPMSAMAKAAPQLVVYMQIVRTEKRPYMTGVTEVEARWLSEVAEPLIALSQPLQSPPPHYSAAVDAVVVVHDATFGRHAWPLPPVERPVEDPPTQARCFAAALLSGDVLPSFADLQPALALPAARAAAGEAQGERRVATLVGALLQRQVFSRAGLAAAWQQDPAFLQDELAAWLRKGHADQLQILWPTFQQ